MVALSPALIIVVWAQLSSYRMTGVSLIVSIACLLLYKSLEYLIWALDRTLTPWLCPYIACTAERFFRIDRAQEHLHFVVDICTDDLYILDPENPDKDELDLFDTTSESESSFIANNNNKSNNSHSTNPFIHSSGDESQESPTTSLRRSLIGGDSHPLRYPKKFSPEEVLEAAKLGDLSLLKQLHHNGTNLLAIDDKGINILLVYTLLLIFW